VATRNRKQELKPVRYYKGLSEFRDLTGVVGFQTPYQYLRWPKKWLPKEDGTPGAWTPWRKRVLLCKGGWHVTSTPQKFANSCGKKLVFFEVEVQGHHDGPQGADNKTCWSSIRLLRRAFIRTPKNENYL